MAYQIKKSHDIVEDIELLDENGAVALTVHVDISPEQISQGYRKAQLDLIHAQKQVDKGADTALEDFGKAVIGMFNVVFGEENTQKILEYFNGKYTDMCVQCMPFISDVVRPAIERSNNAKRSMIANNYKLSRKQRRKLGL